MVRSENSERRIEHAKTDPEGPEVNRQWTAERESCLDSRDNDSAGVRMYSK